MEVHTATEAKHNFSKLVERTKKEPVFITKHGKLSTVMVSVEAFERMKQNAGKIKKADPKHILDAHERSIERHSNVYRALAEYERKFDRK